MRSKLLVSALLSLSPCYTAAQNQNCPPTPSPFPDASSLPEIATLPDPFIYLDGETRVNSTEEWYECRQPEILRMLQEYQYGYYPDRSMEEISAERTGDSLSVSVTSGEKTGEFSADIDLPDGVPADEPVPVVITIGMIDNSVYLEQGIAVATFDYSRVAADNDGETGAFWSLYGGMDIGVLTAWAWGVHRTLDALTLEVPEIDVTKVGVTGCSRLGKGALAAGLFDERITLTMPMSSGIQGLGPYRYWDLSGQGETLENSKEGADWWTNDALGTFVGQSERLPFDAHTIASAIAPRALIVDQGESDPYVNSKGTATVVFPAAKAVYDWLGAGDKIGIAIREGGHCDVAGDANILPFVLETLKGEPSSRDYTDLSPWSAMTEAYPWASDVP